MWRIAKKDLHVGCRFWFTHKTEPTKYQGPYEGREFDTRRHLKCDPLHAGFRLDKYQEDATFYTPAYEEEFPPNKEDTYSTVPYYTARFTTTCPYCSKQIVKGKDRIQFVPNVKNSAVHQGCFEHIKQLDNPETGSKHTLESWTNRQKDNKWDKPTPPGQQPGDNQQPDKGEGKGQSPFDFKLDADGKPGEGQSKDDMDKAQLYKNIEQQVQKRLNQAIPRMEMKKADIEKKLEQLAQQGIEDAVQKFCTKKVVIEQDQYEPKSIDNPHKDFEHLIQLLIAKEHVYSWGPPGSGKSTAAKQAADVLSMDYAYISLNPQTPESRLLGFIDANGVYRPTPFRRIYENGGVFCIDELDNSSPSLLTTLNGCLENGTAAFPDQMVQASDKFIVVATGNTSGRGGDQFFPERRPFDAAFAERFSFLFWDYDEQLERKIALGINPNSNPWVDWVQLVRSHVKERIIRLTVSPRASIKGAKLTRRKVFEPLDIAEKVLFKGLNKDDKNRILQSVGEPPEIEPLPLG